LTFLILKKGYEAITIQDISDEANVGRSNVLCYYTSKDDLKRRGFEHLRKELLDLQNEAQAAPGDIKAEAWASV
jgi:AcrR family transcriptional regulator